MKFKQKLAPLLITLIFCGVVLLTLNDYGITWDEGVYFLAGAKYFKWLKNPSIGTIDSHWSFQATSTEHPPLRSFLGEITRYLLHEKLNLMDSISSFRASTLIFVFFLSLALFSFVARLYGMKIAFIVSLSFFFLPRIFFHSHIAALDYPASAMWFLTIYAYWRGIREQKWIWYASILLGFALLTKLNSYFIYIPVVFYWILCFHRELKFLVFKKYRLNIQEKIQMFSKIIPMFVIPLFIFIAFWPYLWKNPISRILEYPQFSLKLIWQPVFYFGTVSSHLPWHYPFVLTLITIPVVVLIPFFIGLFKIPSRSHRNTNIFILFNALLPLFIISLPIVPKYDGVRLFLPAFPFICVISGLGIKNIFNFAKKFKLEKLVFLAYMLLFSISFYHSIIKYHPFHSSYYNEVIGGVDGAAKGFEVEYWGNAFIGTLPFLNEHSDSTFWIYNHPARYRFYDEEGLLGRTVKLVDKKNNSNYLVLLIRKGHFDEEMWRYYESEKPVFSVRVSKTNLVNIYKLD